VIEDYVKTVNYVHNPAGQNSMVRNLTLEQYQAEKALFAKPNEGTQPDQNERQDEDA
jgi:hypothetical protein